MAPGGAPAGAPAGAPHKDKQMAMCMEFAQWAKSQRLQGEELVSTWKGTCLPGVQAGGASHRYTVMCEALGGAVEEFAGLPGWTPQQACNAVVRVFRQSGVGMSPVQA